MATEHLIDERYQIDTVLDVGANEDSSYRTPARRIRRPADLV